MPRLFTPKIGDYYEEYYKEKGIKFIKGTVLTSFDFDSSGKVLLNGVYYLDKVPRGALKLKRGKIA